MEKNGILYCKDHNISNRCLVCLDKDHSQCQFHSMDKENRKSKFLEALLNKYHRIEKSMISKLMKKIKGND